MPEKNVRGVRVTFGNLRGQVMPLHGICGAPVSPGTNLCERYREIGVPFVRLHRTLSEGTGAYVDISRVFPVFELNENDPENYDFAYTDLLIAAAVESGAQVIYRLGESPDTSGICRHARPPRYVSKWAKIAVQVIRHYNDGWANGFEYGIRYWEIWNEPDRFLADGRCPSFANGSPEQAHALYAAAAAAIKAYNPALQVGGMSFAGCGEMAQAFLTLCGQEKTPLDFLSFHLYTTNPEEAVFAARDFAARATACGSAAVFERMELFRIGISLLRVPVGPCGEPGGKIRRKSTGNVLKPVRMHRGIVLQCGYGAYAGIRCACRLLF